MPSTQEPQSTTSSSTASQPPSIHTSEQEDIVDSLSIAPIDVDTKITITLDTEVLAGVANFFQCQMQLIAQALLCHSSITVWDGIKPQEVMSRLTPKFKRQSKKNLMIHFY